MVKWDRELFYVSTGESGELTGNGGSAEQIAANILAYFADRQEAPRRVVFYFNSGLVMERELTGDDGLLEKQYRTFLDQGIYPVYFAWRANFYPMLWQYIKSRVPKQLPDDGESRRAINPTLEKFATTNVRFEWDGLKKRAAKVFDTVSGGGWRFLQELLDKLASAGKIDYHLVAHGAGALPVATLLKNLAQGKLEQKFGTVSLWAPALTNKVFENEIKSAMHAGQVERLYLYTLNDQLEREDVCAIGTSYFYFSSLLYLVSQGLEVKPGTLVVPIIGMEKYAADSSVLQELIQEGKAKWILSTGAVSDPNDQAAVGNSTNGLNSTSTTHDGFSQDPATLDSTIRSILS